MGTKNPTLRYSTLRVAILAGVFFLLALIGFRGIVLLVLAAAISGLASYVVLSRQRDAMAAVVEEKLRRTRERIDSSAAAEDDIPSGRVVDGVVVDERDRRPSDQTSDQKRR